MIMMFYLPFAQVTENCVAKTKPKTGLNWIYTVFGMSAFICTVKSVDLVVHFRLCISTKICFPERVGLFSELRKHAGSCRTASWCGSRPKRGL